MSLGVHQRKWEMDSLSSMLKLGRLYYEATGDATPFTQGVAGARWAKAVALVVDTYRAMQRPLTPDNFTSVNYTFQTLTNEPKDTAAHGIGRAHRWTGLIRTLFLPSDDSVRLPYHVPGNAFAVVELRGAAAMMREMGVGHLAAGAGGEESAEEGETEGSLYRQGQSDAVRDVAKDAEDLANEIAAAIEQHGVVMHSSGKRIYAMEVDGFGNFFFADDANPPSLLSLPFLGFVDAHDAIYQNTRALLLSRCAANT